MKEKLFESVFFNIEFCNKTLLVACLYRSPSNDARSNAIFVSTLKNCLNLVVNKFTKIMCENCYSTLINKPTRITDSSASVLDHMKTNIYDESIKSGIITSPISDHLPVLMWR